MLSSYVCTDAMCVVAQHEDKVIAESCNTSSDCYRLPIH